jgi:hypothetical protein
VASLITYNKAQLIERVKKHIADGFPTADFSTTDSEILLYVDSALAFGLIGQVYAGAKVEGNLVMPEGYLTTYLLPALTRDNVTKEWYSTLPQPPVSLPLGYSIDHVYFANSVNGKGKSVFLIKGHRVAYREDMPIPFGVRAWVEGSTIKFAASDGGSLYGENCYVRMASTRTSSLTDVMTLPDDAIEQIFNNVVTKMVQRMQLPKDIIADDISAGDTNLK